MSEGFGGKARRKEATGNNRCRWEDTLKKGLIENICGGYG
jgi:hypothetical protein